MATNSRRGFFKGAMDALIASRERQASRYVSSVLLSLDDEALASRGYSRAELKRRAGPTTML